MVGSMEVVPLTELGENLARYAAEGSSHPLGVSMDGDVRFVVIPVEDYQRLRRRDRVAGRTEDLDADTLEAIRTVEPGPRSREAEAWLNDRDGRS